MLFIVVIEKEVKKLIRNEISDTENEEFATFFNVRIGLFLFSDYKFLGDSCFL